MSEAKVNFYVETLEPRLLLATFNWTGAGGDMLWSNPANWTVDTQAAIAPPSINDDVTITTGNVILNRISETEITAINSLTTSGNLTINPDATLSAPVVNINNGIVTVNGGWNVANTYVNANISGAHGWTRGKIIFNSNVSLQNLTVQGGATLDGTGDVLVNGKMTWGGALYGSGRLILAKGSISTISNNTFVSTTLAKTLDNFGTITWAAGAGSINSVPGSAIFNNYGTFIVENDYSYRGQSVFNNYGEFTKNTTSTILNVIYPEFHNSGTYSPQRFTFMKLYDQIQPFTITTSATPASYTVGKPVTIDSGLTITQPNNFTISEAIVAISYGYQVGDTLSYIETTGISAEFEPENGLLIFSGNATMADYQNLFHSVQFCATDSAMTNRQITFVVNGENSSGQATVLIEKATEPTDPIKLLEENINKLENILLTKGQVENLQALLNAAVKMEAKKNGNGENKNPVLENFIKIGKDMGVLFTDEKVTSIYDLRIAPIANPLPRIVIDIFDLGYFTGPLAKNIPCDLGFPQNLTTVRKPATVLDIYTDLNKLGENDILIIIGNPQLDAQLLQAAMADGAPGMVIFDAPASAKNNGSYAKVNAFIGIQGEAPENTLVGPRCTASLYDTLLSWRRNPTEGIQKFFKVISPAKISDMTFQLGDETNPKWSEFIFGTFAP